MREYQVPVMFDVTADSQDDANRVVMDVLAQCRIPGMAPADPYPGDRCVESWWTVERDAKRHDGNDNDHGVVVFERDLDYLYNLLRLADVPSHLVDPERAARLMRYFDPHGRRSGTDDRR